MRLESPAASFISADRLPMLLMTAGDPCARQRFSIENVAPTE
jgi:hypothetical protein